MILTEHHISGCQNPPQVSPAKPERVTLSKLRVPTYNHHSAVRSSLRWSPLDDQKITGNLLTVQRHVEVGDSYTLALRETWDESRFLQCMSLPRIGHVLEMGCGLCTF
jgi:hypothetical protein